VAGSKGSHAKAKATLMAKNNWTEEEYLEYMHTISANGGRASSNGGFYGKSDLAREAGLKGSRARWGKKNAQEE